MKFVVGSGQSGAVGGPGMEGGDLSVNENVFIWKDDTQEWVIADPSLPPFKPATQNGVLNNTLWNFCKELQENTGEDVYFVLSGQGGAPISYWADGATQWTKLDQAVENARSSSETLNATVDYFAWYHGEADATNVNYKDDFLSLRQRAINSGWLEEDTKVIWGEPNTNYNEAKESMLNMIGSGSYEWLHVADNYGVEYTNGGSGAHVTGNGAVQYGHAFYEASVELYQQLNHWSNCTRFDFGTIGNDQLKSNIRNTYMYGGEGADRISSLNVDSVLNCGEGDDLIILRGSFYGDRVGAGVGNDTLRVYLQPGDTYTFIGNEIVVNNEDPVIVWNTETINFYYA